MSLSFGLFLSAAACKKAASSELQLSKIDMSAWNYNAEDDVYYQLNIQYVANPADAAYENLGIFVPAAYFNAADNGDGSYTLTINKNGKIGDFSVENAAFVMPIQTPGYSACDAPSAYTSAVKEFTDAGLIFIYAGARGREHGLPAGVTDFKAAIRYIRYNKDLLPGNTENYFTYGMSGGGAQSALLGATGDAPEYEKYLQSIGAVMTESDAILGSMDWCPITNLNVADEAYEWELGLARSSLDEESKAISDGLAREFALYFNTLNLKDENGNLLSLEESEDGLYHAGSYYDYLISVIEESLNNFLSDTVFPYNANQQKMALGNTMMMAGAFGPGGPQKRGEDEEKRHARPERMAAAPEEMPEPQKGRSDAPIGMPEAPEGMPEAPEGRPGAQELDGINRGKNKNSVNVDLNGTYNSVEEYIAALNAKEEWVIYDPTTNRAKIISLQAFMKNVKELQKSIGAFDDMERNQGENTLFGLGDGKGLHFDAIMAKVLKEVGSEKAAEYESDLQIKDFLGSSMQERNNMYNPMYYLSPAYSGYKTSTVAKYWRVNAGIFQGDTAISTELIYSLALKNYGEQVKSVDFTEVWGLHHVEAERSGTCSANFISWIKACLK